MKPHALCATALLSAAFMVIGSELADATEFAVLRQRFDHNGITFNSQSGGVATPVENLDISLNTAQTGTLQSVSSSLGIVNPDSNGLGTAATFDVFYTGSPGDFPASSFFDIFVDINDPGSGQPGAMQRGTVKFFNETKGFGFDVSTQFGGNPNVYLNSLLGQINSSQTGLSVGDVQIVQPSPIDPSANSFFDIFVELQFNGAGLDPSQPLFEIATTGAVVPEPSTWILAAMGVVALVGVARRRLQLRAV
jgi:hypothetical protein